MAIFDDIYYEQHLQQKLAEAYTQACHLSVRISDRMKTYDIDSIIQAEIKACMEFDKLLTLITSVTLEAAQIDAEIDEALSYEPLFEESRTLNEDLEVATLCHDYLCDNYLEELEKKWASESIHFDRTNYQEYKNQFIQYHTKLYIEKIGETGRGAKKWTDEELQSIKNSYILKLKNQLPDALEHIKTLENGADIALTLQNNQLNIVNQLEIENRILTEEKIKLYKEYKEKEPYKSKLDHLIMQETELKAKRNNFENKCSVIKIDEKIANNISLDNLKIKLLRLQLKANAAYVRCHNQLFYINKNENNCKQITMSKNQLNEFDNKIKSNREALALKNSTLDTITAITGHIHKRDGVDQNYSISLKEIHDRIKNLKNKSDTKKMILDKLTFAEKCWYLFCWVITMPIIVKTNPTSNHDTNDSKENQKEEYATFTSCIGSTSMVWSCIGKPAFKNNIQSHNLTNDHRQTISEPEIVEPVAAAAMPIVVTEPPQSPRP